MEKHEDRQGTTKSREKERNQNQELLNFTCKEGLIFGYNWM